MIKAARLLALFVAVSLPLLPAPVHAQFVVRSWLDWRTIETPRFAFHYPAELETWTRAVASHIEAIDSAVTREVGYTPARRTDIVVDDPYQTANGSAWPFLNRPVINLWANPPSPREDIGEFRDWGTMLVSHEFTHIAHLTRPSRNPVVRHLWEAFAVDLGPIALRAPRWAIEGYATYVEGRVTGSGRPHGAWRAAFLRQWAIEGQMPRYDQLNAWGAYNGGEFAYLAGSAYLEWLAARRGEGSLREVWRRLSARQNRTFAEAFAGVFGESPAALYGRFAAELTRDALEAERRTGVDGDTGTIVQRLSRGTGDPAISPDGKRVALVVRSATLPSRVIVWSTAPEPDTGKARRDSILLARDPEDVPARPFYPPPKKTLAELQSKGGSPYEAPRFLRDGRILLWRYVPRGDGSLTSDLYLWDPSGKSVHRVTRNASVRNADPSPDGRFAIANRCTRGWCDLVRVDLASGAVTLVDSGGPTKTFDRPRVSVDGARIAVAMNAGSGWRVRVIEIAGGGVHDYTAPGGANLYDPTWSAPTALTVVSERNGVPNIALLGLNVDGGVQQVTDVTDVTGAAVAPEYNRVDGSIWFLSLYSAGYDVRRTFPPRRMSEVMVDTTSGLAGRVPPAPARELPTNIVSAPRPFSLDRRLFRWVPQPVADADGGAIALGLTSIDIVGRSELIATGALGDRSAWRGGALAAEWRGTRPALRLRAFAAEQWLSESRSDVALAAPFDARVVGVEAAIDGARAYDTWSTRYRLGGSAGSVTTLRDSRRTTGRDFGFGEAAVAWHQRHGAGSTSESMALDGAGGRSSDGSFGRALASVSLSASGILPLPLALATSYGRTNADAPPFERFALGGGASPLLDRPLLAQRLPMPALPAAISVGSSAFTYRAAIPMAGMTLYYWGGSTASAAERFRQWHRVIGAEWSGVVDAIPVAGTPEARWLVGAGESLDAPFRRRVRGYVGLVLSP